MRLIEVRQPREHDVIGRRFTIAGFGTGFEATVLWRVLGEDGTPLAEGLVQGVGCNGVIQDFGHDVQLPGFGERPRRPRRPAGLRGRRLRARTRPAPISTRSGSPCSPACRAGGCTR